MMMLGGRAAGGGRCPFTATQWQELEHQALIYKYMASGVPIPSDLLLPLRRSFLFDSALAASPSLAFSPQSSLGWGCFGMGFGRKAEDPEPGRCRRTDGKKWRCSKEAYPDSKYCEKHMHRGKNRSRKPVEMSLATPPPPSSSSSSLSASSSSANASSAAINAAATTTSAAAGAHSYHHHHRHDPASPYTHHALYGRNQQLAAAGGYQVSGSPFHLHLDTTHPHPPPSYYSASAMDHHHAYGHTVLKEPPPAHGGEHAFFSNSDSHATDRPSSDHVHGWQFKQLGMDPHHKQLHNSTPVLFPGGGYGNGNGAAYAIDLCKEDDEEKERRQQQQHCFLLGADLRLDKPSSQHDGTQAKPLRPFFDEWPHENKGGGGKAGSWMGLDGETQLSISIPMASAANDLPITTTSRYHHGE